MLSSYDSITDERGDGYYPVHAYSARQTLTVTRATPPGRSPVASTTVVLQYYVRAYVVRHPHFPFFDIEHGHAMWG